MSAITRKGQPDLSIVYAIHHALTEDAGRLVAAIDDLAPEDRVERLPNLLAFLTGYITELESHHAHEDQVFFPALAARVGAATMRLPQLDAQHHGLDEALATLRAAVVALADERTEFSSARARATDAAQSLRSRLTEHVDLEENESLSVYLTEFTASEHDALAARAQTMDPYEKLFFMVPWLFDRLPVDVRTGALLGAPEVFRTVYAAHVDDYRRLASSLEPAYRTPAY